MSEQVMMSPRVVDVGAELLSGEMQVRAELSDGGFLLLSRTDGDLARMLKRLVDGFPDDRETLSRSLLSGLLRVQAADLRADPEVKVMEVDKLLKTIIALPHKFSHSEAVLAFFEPSAADQTFREDQICRPEGDRAFRQEEDHTCAEEDQELNDLQSPVALSEIMRSNGFCLANTETILFDLTPPTEDVAQSDGSSSRRASAVPAVCLQLCRPSLSPHLLRGFTGMMGRLVKRQSLKRRTTPPPAHPAQSK